ncbi:MAG: hypothetical protein JW778_06895 [Candidatus Altiarchaeota archaeon]|nr:hypothetical protein [Candidatus Altiarchaeota archaeon]
MKSRTLFVALFLLIFAGNVMGTIHNCKSGNIILSTPADGRTLNQECIDAGYVGCEFNCCWTADCMGVDDTMCMPACNLDLPFVFYVCCGSPAAIVNETLCNIAITLWGVSAGVAAFQIVLAGVRWSGSMEDPQTRKEAKTTIIHAIVGLIIVMMAMEIANWLFIGAGSFSIYQFSCAP